MSQNLPDRDTLITLCSQNTRSHKPNSADLKLLREATRNELDREIAIDQVIASLRHTISDLIGIAADDTKADYLMVNRSHLETDLKRLELLCSGLRAQHIQSLRAAE